MDVFRRRRTRERYFSNELRILDVVIGLSKEQLMGEVRLWKDDELVYKRRWYKRHNQRATYNQFVLAALADKYGFDDDDVNIKIQEQLAILYRVDKRDFKRLMEVHPGIQYKLWKTDLLPLEYVLEIVVKENHCMGYMVETLGHKEANRIIIEKLFSDKGVGAPEFISRLYYIGRNQHLTQGQLRSLWEGCLRKSDFVAVEFVFRRIMAFGGELAGEVKRQAMAERKELEQEMEAFLTKTFWKTLATYADGEQLIELLSDFKPEERIRIWSEWGKVRNPNDLVRELIKTKGYQQYLQAQHLKFMALSVNNEMHKEKISDFIQHGIVVNNKDGNDKDGVLGLKTKGIRERRGPVPAL